MTTLSRVDEHTFLWSSISLIHICFGYQFFEIRYFAKCTGIHVAFFHQDIIQEEQNIFQLMKLKYFSEIGLFIVRNFNFQMTNQGNEVKTEITIVQQTLILTDCDAEIPAWIPEKYFLTVNFEAL